MELTLLATGQIANILIKDSSLWRDVDSLTIHALQYHTATAEFVAVSKNLVKDSMTIRLSTSVVLQPGESVLQLPIRMLDLPSYTRTLAVLRPAQQGPMYPEEMRRKRLSGNVLVQFYINQLGHAEMETFKILRVSDGRFVQSVRHALQRLQFIPESVNDCAVRTLVQMPFRFSTG